MSYSAKFQFLQKDAKIEKRLRAYFYISAQLRILRTFIVLRCYWCGILSLKCTGGAISFFGCSKLLSQGCKNERDEIGTNGSSKVVKSYFRSFKVFKKKS